MHCVEYPRVLRTRVGILQLITITPAAGIDSRCVKTYVTQCYLLKLQKRNIVLRRVYPYRIEVYVLSLNY